MTTFKGGPADGQVLFLRRSPDLLRVVFKMGNVKRKGQIVEELCWDALDAPGDQPSISEHVCAYRLAREGQNEILICCRGARGGYFKEAEYEFIEQQPSEDTMRSQCLWDAWCASQRTEGRTS